ncbi:MAG: hypothetical protein NC910_03645, partial [Candidatus Omnitrophica bacterium]|nr:hypothetical protein [Candidatus Omnitrophota bacterium]
PATITSQAKIRIYDLAYADGSGNPPSGGETVNTGSGLFPIKGSLDLTAPDGGESWDVGNTYQITWTKKGDFAGAGHTVRLEYAPDGNSTSPTWATIPGAAVLPAANLSFDWYIDETTATSLNGKVRIIDNLDSTVNSPSNLVFTVKGQVILTQPNPDQNGIVLLVGDAYEIKWSKFGNVANLNLYYSTDNGSNYPNQINSSPVNAGLGAFPWPGGIPDQIGDQLKIKIVDADNPNVFDTSNVPFTIKGKLILTYPNGTENFQVNDTVNIQWTPTGSLGNIKIEYSPNAGTTWTTINGSTPAADGNENWTIAPTTTTSNTALIRLTSNHINPALVVSDVSDGIFTVRGVVDVTYPNAGTEIWFPGDNPAITWTTAGQINNVSIDYSINNGSSWTNITPSFSAAAGSYNLWTIPDTALTTQGRIRVTDVDNGAVTDQSANPFKIRGKLRVDAPTTGEMVVVGNTYQIKWTRWGNFPTVDIEYSTDGGSTYSFCRDSLNNEANAYDASQGATGFPWKVPDSLGGNTKIRITADSGPEPGVVMAETGLFKIVGALTISRPNSSDKWLVQSQNNITWSRTGSIAYARLQYSTNGGSSYTLIIDQTAADALSYPWTIPNNPGIVSTNAAVKITDYNEPAVFDVSDIFTILPAYTVTRPADGAVEKLVVGTPFNITWTKLGDNPRVKITYSINGTDFNPIAETEEGTNDDGIVTNDGSFSWIVPDDWQGGSGLTTNGRIRVAYSDAPADSFDDSDVFYINAGFTVVAPNSSADKWDIGSQQFVRWTTTSTHVPQVKIFYSTDGGSTYPNLLTAAADNTGPISQERTWEWNPVDGPITSQFRVRVEDANESTAFDTSNFNAKIKAFFQVLNPNGNAAGTQNFIVGTNDASTQIGWTWNGAVPEAKVEYSTDGGSTWGPIVESYNTPNDGIVLNDGSQPWTIPDNISPTVKVKVGSPTDFDAYDVSDYNFKIRGNFTLTRPTTGAERFKIGLSDTIEWTTVGNITQVQLIAYSTDPNDPDFRDASNNVYTLANPYVIENSWASTPNGSTVYTWNPIPNKASSTVKVRVVDPNDPTLVYDDSDNAFQIQGHFILANPLFTGMAAPVGSTINVDWTWGGNMTTALIEYSTDGGSNWNPINENEGTANDGVVTNDGRYEWTIPDTISTNSVLRIRRNATDFEVMDVSGVFNIHGNFTLTSPVGGERFIVNKPTSITWDWNGTMSTVKIEYSVDGGTTWNPINESVLTPDDGIVTNGSGSSGSTGYTWTVPDDWTTTAKIRISNPDDPNYGYSISPAVFDIDYYLIQWTVRDALSNAHITGASVSSTDGWVESGLSSAVNPITWLHAGGGQGHPYGSYTATWTHPEYGPKSIPFVANSDQSITVYLESVVVHVYDANTQYVYDPVANVLDMQSTLIRDGNAIVPTGQTSGKVAIYEKDAAGTDSTLLWSAQIGDHATNPISPTALPGNPNVGYYYFKWTGTTLQAGKTYTIVTSITNILGGIFNTPKTFSVNTEKKLVDTEAAAVAAQAKVDAVLGTTPLPTLIAQAEQNIVTAVEAKLDEGVVEVKAAAQEVRDAKDEFETAANEILTSMEETAAKADAATVQLQETAAEAELTQKKNAATLSLPKDVLSGTEASIRFQAAEGGLTPLVTIKDHKGNILVNAFPMSPSIDEESLYVFDFDTAKFASQLTPGKPFSVTVNESKYGSFRFGDVLMTATTLDAVAAAASSESGVKRVANDIMETLNQMRSQIVGDTDVSVALQSLNSKVDRLPALIAQESDKTKSARTINQIAQQLKDLGGDLGVDIGTLVAQKLEESPSMKQVVKSTDLIQGAVEVVQGVIEQKLGGTEDVVVNLVVS